MRDQFWTILGYSLVQVNYVGSSGYGKEYMNMLNLRWGVNDIADAASCVQYLAEEGLIDPKRVGVTGHLAGGYATMQALGKFPDTWAAGIVESGFQICKLCSMKPTNSSFSTCSRFALRLALL
jgi:dipeptidyl aminopeptidase/acylaminoacyl peptidase